MSPYSAIPFLVCLFICGCSYKPPSEIFRFTETIAFKIDEAAITQYDDFKMLNVRSIWLEEDPTEKYWIRITWNKPHDIKPPELKSWYYKVYRTKNETEGTPFMLEIKGPILSDTLLVTLESKEKTGEPITITVPYGRPIQKSDNKD